jgi:hypothetical protein
MSLPFRFDDLMTRFADVRPWAKTAVGEGMNRCAICMGYTLQITPSAGDASITEIPGVKSTFSAAGPIKAGPSPTSAAVGGIPAAAPYTSYFFIRATDLLPRVLRAYGRPDVQGVSKVVWPSVIGRKGVLHLERCYQTEGDKSMSIPWLYESTSGGHWDLFDGFIMVAQGLGIRGTDHPGIMNFWAAR